MRLQRIVIGMDFSDAAIQAALWTARVLAPDAELILAHAIEPADRPRFARASLPPPEAIEQAARDFAERRMRELAASLEPCHPRTVIGVGKASEVVPSVARETEADLIVIGPHGSRPRPARFLGTSADRIVRLSPVPVLVAIAPHAILRKILVAVDDSDVTPTLLVWAAELASAFDADVTLLHVLSNAVYSDVASLSYATEDSEQSARDEIQRTLEEEGRRWLEATAGAGIPREHLTATVTHGNAGDETLATAHEIDADLIILGRRGSGLVAPALLGSTVGTVLHGATCPVLVVTEASTEPPA